MHYVKVCLFHTEVAKALVLLPSHLETDNRDMAKL